MNSFDLSTYFLTLLAIALAPGPCALMILARAAGNDLRGALSFGFGYSLGGVIIVTAVCYGLSAWFTTVPELFDYSKYALMAYLVYLARCSWVGGFNLGGDVDCPRKRLLPSIGAGIAICAVSPYMMIMFPLLVTNIFDVSTITMPSFLILSVITLFTIFGCAGLIVAFAAQLRRFASSPRNVQRLNRGI